MIIKKITKMWKISQSLIHSFILITKQKQKLPASDNVDNEQRNDGRNYDSIW